ncbi:MAG: DMT family transporter [Verrucomicrobiales bacterium]|nr:DMT family transporter [Verrucomicrobiales bacterium]
MLSQGDLYAIASGFFWSFSVILMRVSGFTIPPVPLTFFKSFVAIAGFLLILVIRGEPLWPELTAGAYLRLTISAILGISIADTMFAAALNRLGASLQAIADCIYAPAVTLVGFLMFKEGLHPLEFLGGALVVSGVFVGMVVTSEVKSKRDLMMGTALAAGAHVTMAFGILMVRDLIRSESLLWIAAYRFGIALIALGLFSALCGSAHSLFVGFRKIHTWKTTIPMAILGPFLATLFWIAGFKYETVGRVAIYNQLSTVFIIILAWLILKEKMTLRKTIGVILAAAGSVLVALH